MRTEIFWIDLSTLVGRLGTSPRPRGGDWLEDEVRAWALAGVDHVVSLLEPDEVTELELGREGALCAANGVRFTSLPVSDRGLPDSQFGFRRVVQSLAKEVAGGASVLAHCRQGIGRASLLAAGVLVASGVDAEAAFAAIESARGRPVPDTPVQRQWLIDVADFIRAGV